MEDSEVNIPGYTMVRYDSERRNTRGVMKDIQERY